ncbi:MAG: serine hydrolase domain-containing protein [Pedobacter sp.]|nr:serine hydrolase domain-containing protein [Pedobacter sp.]MDQ8054544.1 serine hydrolase domain-containing protein [Pedobacter sp.]
MKSKFVCLFSTLLFLTFSGFAQQIPKFVTDSLDNYIAEGMKAWKIPGLSVSIVKDGKVIFEKGYGVVKFGESEKVDAHTLFPTASVGKNFLGAALAKLDAQGKLSLNDKVERWLPWFHMKDRGYGEQLMVIDLLTHRSGWKTFQGDLLNTESNMDVRTMLQKFSQLQPVYPLRTTFGYSNFGYQLAGEIIEPAYGSNWQEYIKKELLEPLGMKNTLIDASAISQAKHTATAHTVKDDQVVVLPMSRIDPQPYGGFLSSAHDMGIWMNALLNKGQQNGQQIIPATAIDKMWKSYTIIGKGRAADRKQYLKTYGLGIEILQYQGVEEMHHTGAYSGTLTMMGLIPSLNLGITILTNQDAHNFHEVLKWQVFDAFLGKLAPNYIQTILAMEAQRKPVPDEKKSAQITPVAKLPVSPKEIEGTYTCASYGTAKIEREGDRYILTLAYHPGLEGILTPLNEKAMKCTYSNVLFGEKAFPFEIEDGKIKGFTLYVDSFVESDGYTFVKTGS